MYRFLEKVSVSNKTCGNATAVLCALPPPASTKVCGIMSGGGGGVGGGVLRCCCLPRDQVATPSSWKLKDVLLRDFSLQEVAENAAGKAVEVGDSVGDFISPPPPPAIPEPEPEPEPGPCGGGSLSGSWSGSWGCEAQVPEPEPDIDAPDADMYNMSYTQCLETFVTPGGNVTRCVGLLRGCLRGAGNSGLSTITTASGCLCGMSVPWPNH